MRIHRETSFIILIFALIFIIVPSESSTSYYYAYPKFIPYVRHPIPVPPLPSALPLSSESEIRVEVTPTNASPNSTVFSTELSSVSSPLSSSTVKNVTLSTPSPTAAQGNVSSSTTISPSKPAVQVNYPYRPNIHKQKATQKSPSFSWRLTSMLRSMREGFEEFTSSFDPGIERVIYLELDSDGFEKLTPLVEIRMKSPTPADFADTRTSSLPPPKILSCRVYTEPKSAQERLKSPVYSRAQQRKEIITNEQMTRLLSKCQRNPNERISHSTDPGKGSEASSSTMEEVAEVTRTQGVLNGVAIWPGTKWCGAGNIADNDDDLGSEKEADSCCRDHDKCPDNIPAGETKYNLTNKDGYTKSACECDAKFYDCLRNAKSFVGDQIGRMYFNVIQMQCFRNEYPVVNCTQEKGFLMNTFRKSCQKYDLDDSQAKRYQFFDPPFFVGQAGPLLNIPVVSSLLEKPVNDLKNISINGGGFGNIIAG